MIHPTHKNMSGLRAIQAQGHMNELDAISTKVSQLHALLLYMNEPNDQHGESEFSPMGAKQREYLLWLASDLAGEVESGFGHITGATFD